MKKRSIYGLLPIVLLAAVSTAHADCPFEGGYAGLAIGQSSTLGRSRTADSLRAVFPGGVSEVGEQSERNGLKKNSFAGEIFTGYGCDWDKFYLGAEAYFKTARGRAKNTATSTMTTTLPTFGAPITLNSTTTTTAKLRNGEFGIDIRPGVLLTPSTMLYGRVGAAFNRIQLHTTTVVNNNAATLVNSRKKNATGLRLGGGMEHEFCSNWALRVDYVYTSYRKVNGSASQAGAIVAPPLGTGTVATSTTGSAKLNNHTTMLGVAYYW
jgi:opacity protein-like surface antigen